MTTVRPTTTLRHEFTVVAGGRVTVHRVDLDPQWTLYYQPAAVGAPTGATPMLYADNTAMTYADNTAMEYAA